jgi:hypothetical protein
MISKFDFEHLNFCGDEARRWLAATKLNEELVARLLLAIRAFHKYDLDEGRRLLSAVAAEIESEAREFPSITHLLWRQYWTVKAYSHYLDGDLEAAGAALDRAEAALKAVLSLHPFLLPLAFDCIDFLLQRARIARRENRWEDVKRLLDDLEKIYGDRLPFCVLDSGTAIHLSDIRAFFRSLPHGKEQDLISKEMELPHLQEMVLNLPDFVIPYP